MLSRPTKPRQATIYAALSLLIFLLAGCASTSERDVRFYELEGARNFRDFGGYMNEDGDQVAWGKLFRSNQPAGMTSADYASIAPLDIATVVDFRTVEERETDPTNWQGERTPKFVLLPMGSTEAFLELDVLIEAAIEAEDTAALRKLGAEVYRRMPSEYATEFGDLLRDLASEQSLPTMIHCHAGKDRTGIGAALILSLLGVPRDTIMADYLYSNDRLLNDGVKRTPIEQIYWGVEADWLQASFDAIEEQYGSVDRYIEVALGIDAATRARIRQNLLQ
ncbi:MAG: tyrosine-protein phosphatase [Gammaproteobacteria bacterium]|nr:tyrosine-protein phosphatase [Gammaproteobacteria bacterium]